MNMHNAHHLVKSKCIPLICMMPVMEKDDRPEAAKRLELARIHRGFETAKDASRFFGWVYEGVAPAAYWTPAGAGRIVTRVV